MRRIVSGQLLVAVATGLLSADSADAQVLSATAIYDRGIVIVRGHTARPHQVVSVGRAWIQRSNRRREFVFHIKRLPDSCMVQLRSENTAKRIVIRNCLNRNRAEL
jgi:hypothetical protein